MKKITISFLVLIIIILIKTTSNAAVFTHYYTTIKFKNINSDNSNIYVLIDKKIKKTDNKSDKNDLAQISTNSIKDAIGFTDINEQYENGTFIEGLIDTNEEIVYNNKTYKKFKVIDDVSLTYRPRVEYNFGEENDEIKISDEILFAKIVNNNINLIVNEFKTYNSVDEFNNSLFKKYDIYHESGIIDVVCRNFFEYDDINESIINNTEAEINKEENRVIEKFKKDRQNRKITSIMKYLIIIVPCILWLVGLVIFSIIKKRKRKKEIN